LLCYRSMNEPPERRPRLLTLAGYGLAILALALMISSYPRHIPVLGGRAPVEARR